MSNRAYRYSSIIPTILPPILLIGCGAIGHAVARLLAQGWDNLQLDVFDHDHVSIENLGPQGWLPSQIDMAKVSALAANLLPLNPTLTLHRHPEKFTPDSIPALLNPTPGTVCFVCVDHIDIRRELAPTLFQNCDLIIDTRMGSQSWEVHSHTNFSDYEKTLFPSSERHQAACTARSTPHCPAICAGYAIASLIHYLKGHRPPLLAEGFIPSFEASASPFPT
jgi:hypothetical protein